MQISHTLCIAAIALGTADALKLPSKRDQISGVPTGTSDAGEPCASVASALSVATTFPAQLAYDCLTSVPLQIDPALALAEALPDYVEWQSTLQYLEDPTPDYLQLRDPVDIRGNLDAITGNITSGGYANEYEFQVALWYLFTSAYDGHFYFTPDALSVFAFERSVSLVSVSLNGTDLPKIYSYNDIVDTQPPKSLKYTPSAVTMIDGISAQTYMETLEGFNNYQDPDAGFNANFWQMLPSGPNVGYYAYFGILNIGSTTQLTFENGTTRSYSNFAYNVTDFTGVDSGESFYETFCSGSPPSAPNSSTSANPYALTGGYQNPVIAINDSSYSVAGYFLNDTAHSNVAVLSVPSFEPNDALAFQSVVQSFLASARAAKKTQLIIDLRGNGGGDIVLGYDLFKQLFPLLEPYGASRLRDHESLDIIGQQFSALSANNTNEQSNNTNVQAATQSPYDYRTEVQANGKDFSSWEQLYGPYEVYGDEFTALLRYNLSDPASLTQGQINVTGYNDRSNVTTQPFASNNIIMLYDGTCSSTCTIFSEFMKTQGGVYSMVVGGFPYYGAMQGVGGTKGAQEYTFQNIYDTASATYSLGTEAQQEEWNSTDLALDPTPLGRSSQSSVNLRDNIREGDTSQTPLQFVYEAADCRIFYTPSMITNVQNLWNSVANITWGIGMSNSTCVKGSYGSPSALSGGAPYFG
ncbi:MAG: hypothetical protein M1827_006911 [Pycnora praestabilis]|nr:MAG: hypothetical protein M1827_006911 [Pycnora praestabilis]